MTKKEFQYERPRYMLGQVIDLSYKNGGLPNRIRIDLIYMDDDKGWKYLVLIENMNEQTTMDQKFIHERECNKFIQVYNDPSILTRYADGWRFCGNFGDDNLLSEYTEKLKSNHNILGIRIYQALSPSAKVLPDKVGLWIRYKHPIDNNGNTQGTLPLQAFRIIK